MNFLFPSCYLLIVAVFCRDLRNVFLRISRSNGQPQNIKVFFISFFLFFSKHSLDLHIDCLDLHNIIQLGKNQSFKLLKISPLKWVTGTSNYFSLNTFVQGIAMAKWNKNSVFLYSQEYALNSWCKFNGYIQKYIKLCTKSSLHIVPQNDCILLSLLWLLLLLHYIIDKKSC